MKRYVFLLFIMINSNLVMANTDAIAQAFLSYDEMLKLYVKPGEKQGIKAALVDYQAWAKDSRHQQIMKRISQINPRHLRGNEKKAFWINTYNLLTIDLIISQNEKESIKNLGNFIFSPWRKFDWVIGGKSFTLDQIEHDILRPMGDARIHMAINCASLSCPDLRPEAYSVEVLDKQMDEQTRAFLGNATKGLSANSGEISLSKIFKWFEDDFASRGGVASFVREYTGVQDSDFDYLDYNWMLNSL